MNSIAAIANRIQDRANQLSSDRSTLQRLETQLASIKNDLNDEQKKHEVNREELLLQTRIAHEHELEIIKHKQMIRDLERKIQSNTNERNQVEFRIQSIQKQCDRDNSSIFVPHQYETLIFKRRLEHRVHKLKTKRRKREETLDRLALETERNREEVQSMEREGRRLQDEIKMMEDVEVREDEEIAAVAMQIRATLAKVSLFCFL